MSRVGGFHSYSSPGQSRIKDPNQVSTWKKQAMDGLAGVFSKGATTDTISDAEVKELHAKIGRLAVENDFLANGLKRVGR